MKNWFTSLFSTEENIEETPIITEELFTTDELIEEESSLNRDSALEDILCRNHYSAGYRDGFEKHSPSTKADNNLEVISELREHLKGKLKEIHTEKCDLEMYLKQREQLDNSIVLNLEKMLQVIEHKQLQFEDELVAVEEGRGIAAKPIIQYSRGFSTGFDDWMGTKKINERFKL
jgi:hypothetical protein